MRLWLAIGLVVFACAFFARSASASEPSPPVLATVLPTWIDDAESCEDTTLPSCLWWVADDLPAALCDEAAASALAPPPALPIGNARIEAPRCPAHGAALLVGAPPPSDHAPPAPPPDPADIAVLVPDALACATGGGVELPPTAYRASAPSGHPRGIERPPRR